MDTFGNCRRRLDFVDAPMTRAHTLRLTPDDVCEAVEGVRASQTRDDRTEAVARIVRRRQEASAQVREEEAPYSVHV